MKLTSVHQPDETEANKNGETKDKMTTISGQQALSIACYIIVVGVIGLPLWWKTTEVYRVAVPHGEIKALNELPFRHRVRVFVHVTGERSEFRQTCSDIRQLSSDDVLYIVKESILPSNWTQIINSHHSVDSLESRGLPRLLALSALNDMPGSPHLWELPSDSSLMVGHDIIVGNKRNLFIRGASGWTSPYLLPVLYHVVGDMSLRRNKLSTHDVDHDVDRLTRVDTSPAYDVIFSVVNPEPERLKVSWDISKGLEGYVRPFLNSMQGFSNFSVESQNMYGVPLLSQYDFNRKGGVTWSKTEKCFILPETLLSQMITRLEAKLGSFLSTNPALHFILYVNAYTEDQGPLRIAKLGSGGYKFSPTNGIISPRWGGFVIVNHLVNKTGLPSEVSVSSKEVMGVFLAQLRRLLGFPSTEVFHDFEHGAVAVARMGIESSRLWEIDYLKRLRTSENAIGSVETLNALSELLGEIGNLVIRDEIGEEIHEAVDSVLNIEWFLAADDLNAAFEASLEAHESSDKAFFDESLLELLYFPDDQKYAVYIPLFLPVGIPVVSSLMTLLRWWKSRKSSLSKSSCEDSEAKEVREDSQTGDQPAKS